MVLINDELDKCANDTELVGFDDNFPYPTMLKYGSSIDKQLFILDLMKKFIVSPNLSFNIPTAPSTIIGLGITVL